MLLFFVFCSFITYFFAQHMTKNTEQHKIRSNQRSNRSLVVLTRRKPDQVVKTGGANSKVRLNDAKTRAKCELGCFSIKEKILQIIVYDFFKI